MFDLGRARCLGGAAIAALTVVLILFNLRRSGERAGRVAERYDTVKAVTDAQRHMLEQASRRLRNRDNPIYWLPDGKI